MTDSEPSNEVRFGRAVVRVTAGELIEQPVEAIVYAANSRGVMGAGPAGAVRSAGGPEIEREVMAAAPLNLGTVFVTGAGKLDQRGIQAVLHAVVAPHLGDPVEIDDVRRALGAALRAVEIRKFRSIAIPLLGLRAEATNDERQDTVDTIVEELVSHFR